MCSACSREEFLEQQRRSASKSGIAEFVQQHRLHYANTSTISQENIIIPLDTSNASSIFRVSEEEPKRPLHGDNKQISAEEFYTRRLNKKSENQFDPTKRPATRYLIDPNLIKKCLLTSNIIQESIYYQIDPNELLKCVSKIQRWFRLKRHSNRKLLSGCYGVVSDYPSKFYSYAAVRAASGDTHLVELQEQLLGDSILGIQHAWPNRSMLGLYTRSSKEDESIGMISFDGSNKKRAKKKTSIHFF